jgi:hypothetical protein
MNNNYDTIIIGGGIAGLYYVHKFKPKNYILLEKNDRLGGRIYNIQWHNEQISLGGGVIKSTNIHTLKLLEELNLKTNEFISKYYLIDLPGKNPNEEDYYELNKMIINYLKKLLEKNYEEIIKTKLTFNDFLYKYLDNKIYEFIKSNILYLTHLNADVKYSLEDENMYELLRVANVKLKYIIKNGYTELLDKLIKNINYKLNTNVNIINKKNNKYEIICDNVTYTCDKLVLATEKNLSIIKNLSPVKEIYNLVEGCEYIRIYAYWKDGHGIINSIKTKNLPSKIIRMNDNILMICYTESYNAVLLNNFFQNHNKEEQINYVYKLLIDSKINIKKPDDLYYKFWKIGTHFFKPNTNFNDLRNKIKNVAITENIHIIGEPFSNYHGWVDSAIYSVDLLLHELNK